MPDSMLPIQGPASQRERDLDVLLSGAAGYPAVVLGPVADALAALCAAPAPSELDGEAAARAAFRLFVLPGLAGAPAALRGRQAVRTGKPAACSRDAQPVHGMPGRGHVCPGPGAGRP